MIIGKYRKCLIDIDIKKLGVKSGCGGAQNEKRRLLTLDCGFLVVEVCRKPVFPSTRKISGLIEAVAIFGGRVIWNSYHRSK